MWEPRRLTTLWVSTASYRDSCTFTCSTRTSLLWKPKVDYMKYFNLSLITCLNSTSVLPELPELTQKHQKRRKSICRLLNTPRKMRNGVRGCEDVNYLHLAQSRKLWRRGSLINAVMNIEPSVPLKSGNFVKSRATVGSPRRHLDVL
jgi:hypothetical protein